MAEPQLKMSVGDYLGSRDFISDILTAFIECPAMPAALYVALVAHAAATAADNAPLQPTGHSRTIGC